MRSPQLTSSMEPSEMKALKPTFSRRLQSSTAVQSAPLWLRKATLPGRAMPAAKVAFSFAVGAMTPRQFGPMMRIPAFRAVARMSCSSATPSGPTSLNPAEMMTTCFTPASAHSRTMAGTEVAGVTITTNSGICGSAFTPG